MVLIGTAGHVDHGKSALVEALTGINPMHIPEELRRELTIELGFAPLKHPDGSTLSIVDVPGHEKLVRTMISGASGFQIALWVVDAREGLMPQSLEHLDILNLLGVPHIIPVVTKADIATADEVAATTRAIEALHTLRFHPVQIVDSISGRGIALLRNALFQVSTAACQGVQRRSELPYLPIDRCFVLGGVGTVVTGTLVRGELRAGDLLCVSSRPEVYRVRSLHHHNTVVEHVAAGQRTGVHLHRLKVEEVQRGDCLVPPGYPYRSRLINVRLTFLPRSEFAWKPGLRALFLAASFELECRIWGMVAAEDSFWAQIQLPREVCFYPGQRFILRSTNPLTTIGGGTVIDIAPDQPRRITEAERNPARYLELSRPAIFELAALARKWMGSEESLVVPGGCRASGLIWREQLNQSVSAKLRELEAAANGQARDWSFISLAAALKVESKHIGVLLRASLTPGFTLTPTSLRFDPQQGEFSEQERGVAERIMRDLRAARLQPLRLAEYAASSGMERKLFDKVIGRLARNGSLVPINADFALERSAWEDLVKQVSAFPASPFTASEFGKRFNLSRKFSVPYLEALHRAGILRRNGDHHQLNSLRRRPEAT